MATLFGLFLFQEETVEKEHHPDPHRELRIELIKLKTDMENAAPELEPLFRETLELSIKRANDCDLYNSLSDFAFALMLVSSIERRLGTGYGTDFAKIENLAKDAIIQGLVENCQCQLVKVDRGG